MSKSLEDVYNSVDTLKQKSLFRRFLAFSGPAFLISVGYMDPGNWATDIAAGSRFGYALIWVLLLSNLMAILLQSLSARLGIVRGKDLAQASAETYPFFVNFVFYILAEISIAATDLAEVLGMAIGLNLLFGLPLIAGVSIAIVDTFLIMLLQNYGMRKMELFILSLISVIALSFLVQIILSHPDASKIAIGFIPSLPDSSALYIAIAIIGATVMPHNLYLHSSLVQTRNFKKDFAGIKNAIKFNFIDSVLALNLAFFVNAAILVLAGAVFFQNNLNQIVDIQDAYKLLQPILGSKLAPILFAVALIAAGQSSTITGTLAGQIVMEGYLNLRIQPWLRRLITRIVAISPAFFTILYFGEKSVGELLILSQVVLSLQLAFAVIPLIHFVSDKKTMGNFALKSITKLLSWLCAFIIVLLNTKLVFEQLSYWLSLFGEYKSILQVIFVPIFIFLGLLLIYIIVMPYFRAKVKEAKLPHGKAKNISKLDYFQYKKIAIAVDFSDLDNEMISGALSLGGKDAEYLIIHIVESTGAKVFGNQIEDMETFYDNKSLNYYNEFLLENGYKSQIKIGFGKPYKEIPKIVEEFGSQLLVMGSHGHKGIMDMIFGETVQPVRHKVKIPVLLINRK